MTNYRIVFCIICFLSGILACSEDDGSSEDVRDLESDTRLDAAGDTGSGLFPDGGLAPDTSLRADCDRECLIGFLTEYLSALVENDPSRLPVGKDVKFTENGDVLELGEGLWLTASALGTFRQDFADSAGEQVGCFTVVQENGSPSLLALRLRVVAQQIVEIETVVTRSREEASIFNPSLLTTPNPIYDELLDESQRSSRERLVEIVDKYFDGIVANDGSQVPFHEQCTRTENGIQTAQGVTIAPMFVIFTYITEIKRRYLIVDQERGLVWGVFLFMVPPGGIRQTSTIFIAELFKVENEEIRSIEAFMVNQPFGKESGW